MTNLDLTKLRKEYKRTQQEVASAADMSLRQYQKYENGESAIPSKKVNALIRAIELNERLTVTKSTTNKEALSDSKFSELKTEAMLHVLLEGMAEILAEKRGKGAKLVLNDLEEGVELAYKRLVRQSES